MLDSIESAIRDYASGKPVVVVDDENRENEGDLIIAASLATRQTVAFMVRYTSGYLCAAITEDEADRLNLPPMTSVNQDKRGTAYTVSVDAREGVTTGISAADRARTIRLLADTSTTPADLTRPGHVVPLRAKAGGVLRRPGHTEAAVDLATLAGLPPAGALGEIVSETDPTGMARTAELRSFADKHSLVMISIADLVAYRRRFERLVTREVTARVPVAHGDLTAYGYSSPYDQREHVAFVCGDIGDGGDVLVRVHMECLAGDIFGAVSCECGAHLDASLRRITAEGRGVVLYIRGQERRGSRLVDNLHSCQRHSTGADTTGIHADGDHPPDDDDLGVSVQVINDLGIRTVRLLSNNPEQRAALEAQGLTITEQVPLPNHTSTEMIPSPWTSGDRRGHRRHLTPEMPSLRGLAQAVGAGDHASLRC